MSLNPFAALSGFLRRLLGRDPDPLDPYASVGAPRRRGPVGRSAAIALAEPDPPADSNLVGRKV